MNSRLLLAGAVCAVPGPFTAISTPPSPLSPPHPLGTIKRWGHRRGLMTHGSKSHREHGSTGPGSTPGRTFPGLKNSGQMGNVRRKVRALKVSLFSLYEVFFRLYSSKRCWGLGTPSEAWEEGQGKRGGLVGNVRRQVRAFKVSFTTGVNPYWVKGCQGRGGGAGGLDRSATSGGRSTHSRLGCNHSSS